MRYLALLLALAAHSAAAQTPADSTCFDCSTEEVPPEVVGGLAALQAHVGYPEADRRAGTQGRVIVRFIVTADGLAEQAEVVRSVSAGLDSAAVMAVRAAAFVPGSVRGEPVRVRMTLPVTFRLAAAAPRRALDADTLLGRLGLPWSPEGLPAPNLTERTDAGQRLVWTAPDAETERITAEVSGDTLRVLTVTARPHAPALAQLQRLATAIDAERVRADSAGYYTAHELGLSGVTSRADVALDLAARTWRFRAPPCVSVGANPCLTSAPVLVGGIRGLQERTGYPRAALQYGTQGRVFVSFELGADGVARDATAGGVPETGPGERALRAAAVRSVTASQWIPATTRGGQPVAVRLTLPITFVVSGGDWERR